MSVGTIAAVVGIGTALYGAYNSYSSSKDAKRAAAQQQKLRAQQLAGQQSALEGLYGEQRDPAEVYADIFNMLPELLQRNLPAFRQFSKDTAVDFTKSNIETRDIALKSMFPEYQRLQDRRVAMIDEMDPANLGQEELKAITRKMSPLIPEGTFDPSTGAVAGGTTSPVSLYRNLISGAYQQRRADYLSVNSAYLNDAESSALRQQERASTFLPQFLSLAGNAASQLTGLSVAQEQQRIQNQENYLNTLLGMPSATYDSAAYDKAIGQNLQLAVAGLSTLADDRSKNAGTAAQSRASTVSATAGQTYYSQPSSSASQTSTPVINYKAYLS